MGSPIKSSLASSPLVLLFYSRQVWALSVTFMLSPTKKNRPFQKGTVSNRVATQIAIANRQLDIYNGLLTDGIRHTPLQGGNSPHALPALTNRRLSSKTPKVLLPFIVFCTL